MVYYSALCGNDFFKQLITKDTVFIGPSRIYFPALGSMTDASPRIELQVKWTSLESRNKLWSQTSHPPVGDSSHYSSQVTSKQL